MTDLLVSGEVFGLDEDVAYLTVFIPSFGLSTMGIPVAILTLVTVYRRLRKENSAIIARNALPAADKTIRDCKNFRKHF